MKKVYYIFLILIFSGITVYSQKKEKSDAAPLPLPEMIITSDARLDIRSGIKLFPEKTAPLGDDELDSLNSLEKHPPLLLPPDELPVNVERQKTGSGFISAAFGRFSTPDISGGYGYNTGDYKFYGNGHFLSSGGHIRNSEFLDVGFNALLDYVAPDKYWIFGGSKTRTTIDLENKNFNLYSVNTAPGRNLFRLKAAIDSKGEYQGFEFNAGAFFESLDISQDKADASDNGIKGYINIRNTMNEFDLGAKASIDVRSVNGDGLNFLLLSAFGKMENDKTIINFEAGFQTGTNSMSVNRSGLLIKADLSYLLNNNITFKAFAESGLIYSDFAGFARMNPYISDSAEVDFQYNNVSIGGSVFYNPDIDFGFTAGFQMKMADRMPVFTTTDTASFVLIYPDALFTKIFLEAYWDITPEDRLTAEAHSDFAIMDAYDNNFAPYLSPVNFACGYRKALSEKFSANLGITFVGSRYADVLNKTELDGFFNVSAGADYKLDDKLKIFIVLDNIINSEIYVWQGYKERGLFASAGILWQF